jgi:hypothetical protein
MTESMRLSPSLSVNTMLFRAFFWAFTTTFFWTIEGDFAQNKRVNLFFSPNCADPSPYSL